MFGNVFLKTLRDQYRGLIGWSIAVVLLVVLTGAVWPSMKDMPDLDQFLRQYPDAMKELFNVDAMTTGIGFLNAELFSLTIPIVFLIYAIARGVRLTASEEESGTYETLLTMPVSRPQVLLHKAAALALSLTILGVVLLVATWGTATLFSMEVGIDDIATGAAAMVLLGIEHGFIAMAVGAASGKRVIAIAASGTIAVGGYMFYAVGSFVDAIEPWRILSPFYQAIEAGPLGGGWPAVYLWMPVVALMAVALSLPLFQRRDIVS